MTTSLRRVSNDYWNEVEKIYKQNNGMISRVNITKQTAEILKNRRKKRPRYIVNYWPISKRKVKVY